jgi:hypothetical protein
MKLSHAVGLVTGAVALAAAANAATADTGAVPDPNVTGVAPAENPTGAVPPGPIAPAPEGTPPPPEPEGRTTMIPESMLVPHGWQPKSRVGLSLSAGAGVADFSAPGIRESTGVAGSWEVRAAVGTRNWWAIEGMYNGSAQSITGLGLTSTGTLIRNGIETTGRLNLPLYAKETLLEPYVFGGVGWNVYSVTGTNTAASDVTSTDNVFAMPFGLGFAVGHHGLMLDGRFTYRPIFGQNLTSTNVNGAFDLNNWNVGVELGYEF